MEPLASPSGVPLEIGLDRVTAAFDAAVAAATEATEATDVIDGALGALHDGLLGAGVSAFVSSTAGCGRWACAGTR